MSRVLTIANGIMVVLLVLTLALWVRSHFAQDVIAISDGYDWTLQAGTSPGRLHINVAEPAIPSQTLGWSTEPTGTDQPVLLSTQGQGEWYALGIASQTGNGTLSTGRQYGYRATSIPFWGLSAALAAIPLLTMIGTAFQRRKTQRRLLKGQCPACGRHLRGSAYHCPVCGHRLPSTTLAA